MRRVLLGTVVVALAVFAIAAPAAANDLCWLLDRWPHC